MLENENARLREQLRLVDQAPHHGASKRVSLDEPTKQAAGQEESQSEALDFSPTGTGQAEGSAFHGPSSGTAIGSSETIHGKTITASGTFGTNPPQKSDNDITQSIKNQLLAETVRQRQLENVNLRAGKLDFRGVEPQVGMNLLSNFWNRQLYAGPIVYRTAFMRDMADNGMANTNDGPYFSELLLYAMLFSGLQFTAEAAAARTLPEVNVTGRQYRAKFEQTLHNSGSKSVFKSEVTTIQALLVVSDALFSWCNERSLSWHYMGLAINMIIDLGLHINQSLRGPSEPASAEATEIKRRLFWAAFVMDKVHSIYQGRPTRLHKRDPKLPIEFLDEFEELESFSSHTYSTQSMTLESPAYAISTWKHFSRLSIVADNIICQLYSEEGTAMEASELFELAYGRHGLYDQLQEWVSKPKHISAVLPHFLSCSALYFSLQILICRPFLSEDHFVSEEITREALKDCVTAALDIHDILVIYKQNFCFKTAPLHISYAAYASASILIRIAAQKSSDSQAHSALRLCVEVLSIQQAYSHGPRRMMEILLRLMNRLGVHVGEFVALGPSSCLADEPIESEAAQPVVAGPSMERYIHNLLAIDEYWRRGGQGDLPISESDMRDIEFPDVGWPDLDFNKLMNSFIFDPAQQDTSGLVSQNELFGLDFGA
ncbi:uncharacterized protein FIESC28_02124 [Fusarium coffeatum]|uniref:Xylanolytic transcriptional activator regulatory domain-containing protein n=1 Tax=Fusarium coffeatum TaxID=231269 RepID=A0A366S6W6_9HYPO|nr:uncharacterized protein FIESC28_02124 [Fusarium coffeatum]RBR25067.1 hypothetical protein FIESC28_02124 [Fusarium coffeatum]